MEISLRLQDTETPPSMNNSPRSNLSNNCCTNYNNSIGIQIPTTPKTILRSDSTNPYPTTFVQADTSTFKQVVQMLTGSSETTKPQLQQQQQQQQQDLVQPQSSSSKNFNIPPMKATPKKQQGFKLYERRNNNNNHHLKNTLMINTLVPNFAHSSGFSSSHHNKPEILSPSLLDFPSLTLSSPVTPLNDDPFDKSSSPSLGSTSSEEERAIAEKGFYLHPSPMSTPRDSEPQLLPLFPVTSPRVSESPS
ncbi:hypothetical protein AAZX31_12G142300 [Glycine max]|uniref:VQ domain-containing protein n=2 Tax=Glycine subgen. Soja TaxID=1462606 RepID=I1LT47_SOYBN|nr:VQ motif-containing protein 4 [Glycine max]KAG5119527.1 hypothetical protein JHK82_033947 [Glycine max]KAG5140514.1 hypothetical protein JHK84_034282 [Glycine max]KHN12239.1 hypothetical protein glysoja_049608 [Glycine soja]KRH26131.1 hypothetical protein GLYMA_12G153600v4 [Glycine max]|eukprot:XP_014620417.1 VQ motif-containing protein 4 [Glycine max]